MIFAFSFFSRFYFNLSNHYRTCYREKQHKHWPIVKWMGRKERRFDQFWRCFLSPPVIPLSLSSLKAIWKKYQQCLSFKDHITTSFLSIIKWLEQQNWGKREGINSNRSHLIFFVDEFSFNWKTEKKWKCKLWKKNF